MERRNGLNFPELVNQILDGKWQKWLIPPGAGSPVQPVKGLVASKERRTARDSCGIVTLGAVARAQSVPVFLLSSRGEPM